MSPRIISALLVAFSSMVIAASARADAVKPLELAPNAPESHTVVAGDTLWGISAKFLKDPYRWPELWRLNAEQVKNPHRIYPGQLLVLDRSGEDPQLKALPVTRLQPREYVTPESREIPAIPQQVIEPFLAQPLVAAATAFEDAPRIVALEDQRLFIGAGSKIYVTNLKDDKAQNWQIYRPGKPLIDPDSKATLGHEAILLGTAKLVRKGEPATLEVLSSAHEIGRNERLIAAPKPDVVSYVPHAPQQAIQGRVMTIYGNAREGGRNSVVSLSRGSKDGLERGHVLALYQAGAQVGNRYKDRPETFKLPDERYGLVFVFRVFDHVAYALVMEAAHEVAEGDAVRTP